MFTELCLLMCRLLKIECHWKTCRIGIAVAEISADTLTDVRLENIAFKKKKKSAKDGLDAFIKPNQKIPWQSQTSENIPITVMYSEGYKVNHRG